MAERRFNIVLNDKVNLQTGLNELYHEAERLIKQIQEEIDKMTVSTSLNGLQMDEKSEYSRAVHNLIVDKTNALKLKLDVQKVVTEVLKFGGDENGALGSLNKTKALSGGVINPADIQKMIQNAASEQKTESEPEKIIYKLK